MNVPHFCNNCLICCPPPESQFDGLIPRFNPDYTQESVRLDRLHARRARLIERNQTGDELEQIDAQIAAEEIWG